MSDGSVNTAVNQFSRRRKKFKQKNSSPGIPTQLGGWDGETLYAASARCDSAILKIFGAQKGSDLAVSSSSADNTVGTAVNPGARRKKTCKQNNSSPGIPPEVIRDAAAPNPGSSVVKLFSRQESSASAASPPSARGSISTALNPRAQRKKKFKQSNSSPGIPPQVEDWDQEILVTAHGVKDGTGVVLRDLTPNGPLAGGYTPAIHHAQPVRWVRMSIPPVPGQFADADHSPGTPPQVEDRDCGIANAATKLGSAPVNDVKDGIGVALQDLTLSGPLTGGSTPAIHHAQPVRWVRRHIPIEPDQFADADK